jgi:predicted DNA-binding protein (UPF0251 family)
MTSISLLRAGATTLAGVLLGLQIIGGWEYTEGGSLYTRASMIAAMVTLAALPVFIEAARREGKPAIAVALFVAFVAFLAYSLPANIGRVGEVKEAKLAQAGGVTRAKEELASVKARLATATDEMTKECGTGIGTKCLGRRNTVHVLEDNKKQAEAAVAKGEVAALGDVSSDTVSWALLGSLSPETVRKGSVVAFAAGLDIVIWALIWFACATAERKQVKKAYALPPADDEGEKKLTPKDVIQFPRPRVLHSAPEVTDHELEALRLAFAVGDGPISNDELARRMNVVKSEASKRVQKGIAAGIMHKQRVGREVAIRLN